MQLTNISRDLLEDAQLNRRYIPATFLDNLTPKKIIFLSKNQNKLLDLKLRKSLKKILDISEDYYKSGNSGLVFLSLKVRISITIASNVYREIGNKLEKSGFNWCQGRVYTTMFDKIKLTIITLLNIILHYKNDTPIHNKKLNINLKEIL